MATVRSLRIQSIMSIIYSLTKLHDSLKLLNLRPGLYILTRKALIFETCYLVRNVEHNNE
jgi:hypothetical protein